MQELLNNIVKHSGANLMQITMENHENRLVISVKDNGKGFSSTALSNGIGLSNIDSRIHFLEADIQRESNENVFNIIINRKQSSDSIKINF